MTEPSSSETTYTPDDSVLGKPINVGVSGIQQVLRCIQSGTVEVRDLLFNECELLYECRACRNLFRSLANFIYHKRDFCKKHFCESMVLFTSEDAPEEVMVVQPESPKSCNVNVEDDQEVELDENVDDMDAETEEKSLSPLTDAVLSASTPKIYQPTLKLTKSKAIDTLVASGTSSASILYTKCVNDLEQKANHVPKKSVVTLRAIDSNRNAVYQSMKDNTKSDSANSEGLCETSEEPMSLAHIREKIEASKIAVLPYEVVEKSMSRQRHNSDSTNSVIARLQTRSDCNTDNLMCLKCNTLYQSAKTLDFHMRTLHSDTRLYYPCPFCKTPFVQLWGVMRHIISIHKKSKEQAYKMREMIKNSGFRKNPDIYKAVVTSDVSESEPTTPTKRNVIPKKRFDEVADEPDSSQDAKKKKSASYSCSKCGRIFNRRSARATHQKYCSITKSEKKTSEVQCKQTSIKTSKTNSSVMVAEEEPVVRPRRNVKKKEENDFVDITACSPNRSFSKQKMQGQGQGTSTSSPKNKANAAVLEKKVLAIINTKKQKCLKCSRRFSTFSNLRRHAAIHIGWNRYKCKYCEYQSYNRSDCRSHIRRNHLPGRPSQAHVDKFVVNLPSTPPLKKDAPKSGGVKKAAADSPTAFKNLPADSPTSSKKSNLYHSSPSPSPSKRAFTDLPTVLIQSCPSTSSSSSSSSSSQVTSPNLSGNRARSPACSPVATRSLLGKSLVINIKQIHTPDSNEKSPRNVEAKSKENASELVASSSKQNTNSVGSGNAVSNDGVQPKKPRRTKEQCLYSGSDTMLRLVTRSGSYPKRDLVGRILQDRGQSSQSESGAKETKVDSSDTKVPTVHIAPASSSGFSSTSSSSNYLGSQQSSRMENKFQKFIYVHEDMESTAKSGQKFSAKIVRGTSRD